MVFIETSTLKNQINQYRREINNTEEWANSKERELEDRRRSALSLATSNEETIEINQKIDSQISSIQESARVIIESRERKILELERDISRLDREYELEEERKREIEQYQKDINNEKINLINSLDVNYSEYAAQAREYNLTMDRSSYNTLRVRIENIENYRDVTFLKGEISKKREEWNQALSKAQRDFELEEERERKLREKEEREQKRKEELERREQQRLERLAVLKKEGEAIDWSVSEEDHEEVLKYKDHVDVSDYSRRMQVWGPRFSSLKRDLESATDIPEARTILEELVKLNKVAYATNRDWKKLTKAEYQVQQRELREQQRKRELKAEKETYLEKLETIKKDGENVEWLSNKDHQGVMQYASSVELKEYLIEKNRLESQFLELKRDLRASSNIEEAEKIVASLSNISTTVTDLNKEWQVKAQREDQKFRKKQRELLEEQRKEKELSDYKASVLESIKIPGKNKDIEKTLEGKELEDYSSTREKLVQSLENQIKYIKESKTIELARENVLLARDTIRNINSLDNRWTTIIVARSKEEVKEQKEEELLKREHERKITLLDSLRKNYISKVSGYKEFTILGTNTQIISSAVFEGMKSENLQSISDLKKDVEDRKDTDFNTKIVDIQTKINKDFRLIESHRDNLIAHVARIRGQINLFETQAKQYSNYSKDVVEKSKKVNDNYRVVILKEVSDNGVAEAKSEMDSNFNAAKSELKDFLEVLTNDALPLQEDASKQFQELEKRHKNLEKEVNELEIQNKKQLESKLKESQEILNKKSSILSKVKDQDTYEVAVKKIKVGNDALDILEDRIAKVKSKLEKEALQKQAKSEMKNPEEDKKLLLSTIETIENKINSEVLDAEKRKDFLDRLKVIKETLENIDVTNYQEKKAVEFDINQVKISLNQLLLELKKYIKEETKQKIEQKIEEDPARMKLEAEKSSKKIREIINRDVPEEDRSKFLDKLDDIDAVIKGIKTQEEAQETLSQLALLSVSIRDHIKTKQEEILNSKKEEIKGKLSALESVFKENQEEFTKAGFTYKKQYYSNFIKNTKVDIKKALSVSSLETIGSNIDKQLNYLKKDLEEVRTGIAKLDDFLFFLESERESLVKISGDLTNKFSIVKVYFPLEVTSKDEINSQFKDFKKEAQEAISANNPEALSKIPPKIERIRNELEKQEKEGNTLLYSAYAELAMKDFRRELDNLSKTKVGMKAKENFAVDIKRILDTKTIEVKTEDDLNNFKLNISNLLVLIKDYKAKLSSSVDLSPEEIKEHQERLNTGLERIFTTWQSINLERPDDDKIEPKFPDWVKEVRAEIVELTTVKDVIAIQKKIEKMDKQLRKQKKEGDQITEKHAESIQKVWEDFKHKTETEIEALEAKGMDIKDLEAEYKKFVKKTEEEIKEGKYSSVKELRKHIKEFEDSNDNPLFWVKEATSYADSYLSRIEKDVRYIVTESMYKDFEERALGVTSKEKFEKFKLEVQEYGAGLRAQDNNVEEIVVDERNKLLKFLHSQMKELREEIKIKREEDWIRPYISDLNHELANISDFEHRMEVKISNLTLPQILGSDKIELTDYDTEGEYTGSETKRLKRLKVKKRYILGSIGNIYLYRQEIASFVEAEYNILGAMFPYSIEGEKTKEYLDLVLLQIDEIDNMLKAVVFDTRDTKYQKYLSGVLTSIPIKYRARVSELYSQLDELNGPVNVKWAAKRGKEIRAEADRILEEMMKDLEEGKIDPDWNEKNIGTVPPFIKNRFQKTRIRYSKEEIPDYKVYPIETTILSRHTVGRISDPREASEVGMMVEIEVPVNPLTKQPYYDEEVIKSIFKDASQQAWHEMSEEFPVPEYDGEYQAEITDTPGKYDYTQKQGKTHQMFLDKKDIRDHITESSKDLPENKRLYVYGKDHVITHKELEKIIKVVNERREKKSAEIEKQRDEIEEIIEEVNKEAEKYKITYPEKVADSVGIDEKTGAYKWKLKNVNVEARIKEWNPTAEMPKVELDEELMNYVELGDLPKMFTKWIKEEKAVMDRHEQEIGEVLAEADNITNQLRTKLEFASKLEKENVYDLENRIGDIADTLKVYARERRKFQEELDRQQSASIPYNVGTTKGSGGGGSYRSSDYED